MALGGDGDTTLDDQDTAGNWCPMTSANDGGQFYFSGFGSATCGTPPSSFSLAPGSSITVNLELWINYDPSNFGPGTQQFTENLYSGTCASTTSCTTDPGLAEQTSGYFVMTYGARSAVSFSSNEIPTTPVPEGYQIRAQRRSPGCVESVRHHATFDRDMTYLVDGTTVGTSSAGGRLAAGDLSTLSTAGLIPRDPHHHPSSTQVTRSTPRVRTRRRSP